MAELRQLAQSKSPTGAPTVLEFAGAIIHDNGRITTWPDGQRSQKETGRREATERRIREHFKQNLIQIRRQLGLDIGKFIWPKDDDKRAVVMSPALRRHQLTMPQISDIVFPTPHGGYMRRST